MVLTFLHFATVHKLDVDFDLVDEPKSLYRYLETRWSGATAWLAWKACQLDHRREAQLPCQGRRWVGGDTHLRAGAQVQLYGPKGTALAYPLGGVADHEGISEVDIFLIAPRKKGLWGFVTAWSKLMLTIVMLGILRDDDVKAFPHMRFNIGRVMKEDASVTRMVKFLNGLPISSWSREARRWLKFGD